MLGAVVLLGWNFEACSAYVLSAFAAKSFLFQEVKALVSLLDFQGFVRFNVSTFENEESSLNFNAEALLTFLNPNPFLHPFYWKKRMTNWDGDKQLHEHTFIHILGEFIPEGALPRKAGILSHSVLLIVDVICQTCMRLRKLLVVWL